jgi:hypothetical protein
MKVECCSLQSDALWDNVKASNVARLQVANVYRRYSRGQLLCNSQRPLHDSFRFTIYKHFCKVFSMFCNLFNIYPPTYKYIGHSISNHLHIPKEEQCMAACKPMCVCLNSLHYESTRNMRTDFQIRQRSRSEIDQCCSVSINKHPANCQFLDVSCPCKPPSVAAVTECTKLTPFIPA